MTRSSLFVRWTEPNQWRAKPISLDSANKIKFNIPWAVQTVRYNNAVLDVAKVPAVMEKARDMRVPLLLWVMRVFDHSTAQIFGGPRNPVDNCAHVTLTCLLCETKRRQEDTDVASAADALFC